MPTLLGSLVSDILLGIREGRDNYVPLTSCFLVDCCRPFPSHSDQCIIVGIIWFIKPKRSSNNNRTKGAAAKAGKQLCVFHALPVRSQLFGDCLARQIGSDKA